MQDEIKKDYFICKHLAKKSSFVLEKNANYIYNTHME